MQPLEQRPYLEAVCLNQAFLSRALPSVADDSVSLLDGDGWHRPRPIGSPVGVGLNDDARTMGSRGDLCPRGCGRRQLGPCPAWPAHAHRALGFGGRYLYRGRVATLPKTAGSNDDERPSLSPRVPARRSGSFPCVAVERLCVLSRQPAFGLKLRCALLPPAEVRSPDGIEWIWIHQSSGLPSELSLQLRVTACRLHHPGEFGQHDRTLFCALIW